MAWVTINGVDKSAWVDKDGVSVDEVGNGRWTARVRWRTGYTPAKGNTIIIYESDGVTPYFGGLIWTLTLVPLSSTKYQYLTDCVDFNVYADRRQVFLTYTTDVTEYQVLTDLVAILSPFGTTLDPAQPNPGVTLSPFSWDGKQCSTCLSELGTAIAGILGTSKIWRINSSNVLSLVLPGSVAAPFSLPEGGTNWTKLTWTQTQGTPTQGGYANRVRLRCGPTGTIDQSSWSWTAGGTEKEWYTNYPIRVEAFYIAYITKPAVPQYWVFLGSGVDELNLDYARQRVYQNPADAAYPAGTVIAFAYTGLTPFDIRGATADGPGIPSTTAEDAADIAAQGIYEAPLLTYTSPILPAAAITLAAGYRQQLQRAPKVVTVETQTAGLTVGQTLTISLAVSRACAGTFLISQVRRWPHALRTSEYVVTAVEGAEYLPSALQVTGSGATGGISISGGSAGVVSTSAVRLGGSRRDPMVADTWQYVSNFEPYTAPASEAARIRVFLFARAAAVGVTARLYNMSDAVAVSPTSAKITTQRVFDLTDMTTFDVSLVAGKTYALQILSDTAGALVYGQGTRELA